MKVHRIDHMGINVNDLSAAKAFFLDLGFELQGEGSLEGAWLDRIVGLNEPLLALIYTLALGAEVVQPSASALTSPALPLRAPAHST